MAGDELPAESRRLLEAFGYHWNKAHRLWLNEERRGAVSQDTVSGWTVDELRDWLTRNAGKP
jgi:hypothetical protein